MSEAAKLAAYIVEGVVMLFDDAPICGSISSVVGSRFEARARAVLAALQAEGIESEVPPIPDYVQPGDASEAS